MKALRKPLSLFMAMLMCLGIFAGTGTTAFAAGETMTTYMVEFPRASDPNKAGWGHSAMNFLGGWSTGENNGFTIHTQDSFNGKVIYCIEPGVSVHSGDQFTGRGEDFWDDYPSDLNPTIPPDTIKEYIGRIMTYGWQGNASTSWMTDDPEDASKMAGAIATQLLVWETVVGERDSQFNHVDANAQGKNNIAEYTSPENPLYSEIFSQYSAIESAVKRHTMLPSFFSSTADAGAYELKWDGQQYSLTLTDTNGVLGDYTFTSNITGLNFSVDGNQLTITSSQAIKGSVTVKAEKISAQRSGVVVWTDGIIGGGKQDFATYGETVSDYMVGYLNLEVKTGNMKLVKTSEDGQVAGISFTITGEGYSATKTTNEAGEIDISDLNPGVYTVTEQSIDKYEPQESQRVTIVSGQTATVTFSNVLKRGSLEVTKTSEDGLVEGMTFHLYGTSLSGQPVDEYAVTDGNGVARFENVLIGTGYVLEEVDTPIRYVVPDSQTATIEWNEVTHKSVNNVLKKFRVTVTKSDVETGAPQGDGSLAGATYGLYKGDTLIDSYTTDENGQFTTGYYVCDSDWTIREINPSEGYLLDSSIHKVGAEPELYEIELNDTANDVTEQVIKGDIAIIKHTDDGETQIETPESGAEFQVFLKSAGSYENAKESERDVLVCDENGFAQSKKLPYGTYIVRQTKGWEGTEFMADFDVKISADGQTYRYLINNAEFKSYIKVVKVDSESGNVIPYEGAGFEIYDSNGQKISMTFAYPTPTTIDTFYTNSEGYLITPEVLHYGEYSLVEVQAPVGYVLDSTPVSFTVSADNAEKENALTVIKVRKENTAQKGRISVQKTGDIFKTVATASSAYTDENGEMIVNPTTYTPMFADGDLSGAVFHVIAVEDIVTLDGTVRANAGDVVSEITTDENGYGETEPLYLGKYEVREIKAPYGYVLNNEPKDVEVTYAGQEFEVRDTVNTAFENEYQSVRISLSKVMENDELFEIYGKDYYTSVRFGLFASENITAADGTVIPADGLLSEVSLAENMTAKFDVQIPFGRYYVKEISTDEHYILNGEKYLVNFEYMGQDIQTVDIDCGQFVNLLKRGRIEGHKVDDKSEPLENAVFGLFAVDTAEFTSENAYMTAVSDENGYFEFDEIPYGEYIVREIEAPTGYILSGESYPVTVCEDGETITIRTVNKPITVEVSKVDVYGEELIGADMQLENADGEIIDEWISDGTNHIVTELPAGDYTLKEIAAPDGYVIATDIEFEVFADGTIKIRNVDSTAISEDGNPLIVMVDDTTKVKISKRDITTDKELPGATLQIIDEDGNVVEEWVSADEAHLVEGKLIAGKEYTLREIIAPDGYEIANEIKFTVNEDGSVTEVVMYDELTPVTNTPYTGDNHSNFAAFAMLGAASVILAALIITKKGKRHE